MSSNLARQAARRKQQTRLTFDPIDRDLRSSSPATNLSPANVRYHLPDERNTPTLSRNTHVIDEEEESDDPLSSSKNSNIMKSAKGKRKAKDGRLPFTALPTPVKSSQTMTRGGAASLKNLSIDVLSEDEIEGNRIRAEHRNRKGFTNTLGTSSVRRGSRKEVNLDESDGSPPEDEIETPSKRKKGKQKATSWNHYPDLAREDEEVEDISALPQRTSRSRKTSNAPRSKTRGRRQKSVTLSSSTDNESASPVAEMQPNYKAGKHGKQVQATDEDEDDDNVPIASSSRRQQRSNGIENEESDADLPVARKLMGYSNSPASGISKAQAISIDDESDEDVILSSVNKRRARPTAQDDEQGGGEFISSPLEKPGKRGHPIVTDSEDSDVRTSPLKRQKRIENDEEEDEDSELLPVRDIRSSRKTKSTASSSASTIPSRITRQVKGRKHRTEREKKMELLKRKRAGENVEELTDSEASSGPKRGIYDSDSNSDLEILDEFEDESEPEAIPKPKKKASSMENGIYDSDFVVEDDEDGPLGVPLGLLDIPLQYRHAAHKPMKEHFKDAIEWMVHRKIDPAFSRNDEVYLQAFTKLDDEYMGYAKSKFVSSQWTADFTRAIYARPILVERPCGPGEGYTVEGLPKCDVCNHRKHLPKFALHFEGKAYHKATLEEVERPDSEDSNSESDSDEAMSLNSKGHSLPAEDKEWFSGINNAQLAHSLIHWKYALNEWVIDQLETEGYLTPEQLAEREKMKAKKRREYANALVDGWEETGIIKNLYADFKRQLESARESKQGRWE
ncbi:hypothetical protein D0Z07_4610 [Hyphodiscus hymeniophilus]|uniref:DUF4211 domain-containing protein n=1 Tax=Hyphodiscus hymeniophilus TaxID=353542 RepID=A0A9P6VJ35_9HELO|nr:hypothetical protein D0Z07_4610 [Hyphodiscus hymeniophilus]